MKKEEIRLVSALGVIGIVLAVITFAVESMNAKWICGILAVFVICFAIVIAVDAMIKNKRQPKDFADILMKAMNEAAKSPDFTQKMTAAANRRDALSAGQRPDASDYGYSPSNPIMTSTIFQSDVYLEKLRTLDGKPLTWERTGSICLQEIHGVENVIVDAYQLLLDGQAYKEIYICPYGHNVNYVPQGLKLVE
ncbi:MAG: hypothetical protein ACI3VU_01530 [Faecousia sp.]